jgi:hypothetical protein
MTLLLLKFKSIMGCTAVYLTTWQYVPEYSKLRTHRRENLKSHAFVIVWSKQGFILLNYIVAPDRLAFNSSSSHWPPSHRHPPWKCQLNSLSNAGKILIIDIIDSAYPRKAVNEIPAAKILRIMRTLFRSKLGGFRQEYNCQQMICPGDQFSWDV